MLQREIKTECPSCFLPLLSLTTWLPASAGNKRMERGNKYWPLRWASQGSAWSFSPCQIALVWNNAGKPGWQGGETKQIAGKEEVFETGYVLVSSFPTQGQRFQYRLFIGLDILELVRCSPRPCASFNQKCLLWICNMRLRQGIFLRCCLHLHQFGFSQVAEVGFRKQILFCHISISNQLRAQGLLKCWKTYH